MREPTAAAEPPEDPPVQCAGFHGLPDGPCAETRPVVPRPSSCWLSTPTITAPASRNRRKAPDAPRRVQLPPRPVVVATPRQREHVLHSHRNAGQRPRRRRSQHRSRLVREGRSNGVVRRVAFFDPRQGRVEQIAGGQLSRRDRLRLRTQRKVLRMLVAHERSADAASLGRGARPGSRSGSSGNSARSMASSAAITGSKPAAIKPSSSSDAPSNRPTATASSVPASPALSG